jgi:hypothetical protein
MQLAYLSNGTAKIEILGRSAPGGWKPACPARRVIP